MKEMLFRGKRIDNGEWIYGGYHYHIKSPTSPTGDTSEEIDMRHLIVVDGTADWNMPTPIHFYEVEPKTLGQFTGRRDKNNNKIYEGDIIVDHNGTPFTVKWQPLSASWKIEGTSHYFLFCMRDEDLFEIIGNIHDNEEVTK